MDSLKKLTDETRKLHIKLNAINDSLLKQLDFAFNDNVIKMLKTLRQEYLLTYTEIINNEDKIRTLKQQQKNKNIKVIGSL